MKLRIGAVLGLLLMLAAWSAALASARGETFVVSYSGAGSYSQQEQTSVVGDYGMCSAGATTLTQTENTNFSWSTSWRVSLSVGAGGRVGGASKRTEQASSPLADDASSVADTGTGGCDQGSYDCHGTSEPQPGKDAQLTISGAGDGGSTRFEVGAIDDDSYYVPKDFTGSWTGDPTLQSTCEAYFTPTSYVLMELEAGIGGELTAKFPVKAVTLATLHAGHYFKVRIDPGHYAITDRDNCFSEDGCNYEHFHWHGVVEVKKLS